jgi:hypothetical protein
MGYEYVNTGKRKAGILYGREKIKRPNPIAYQLNTSEIFINCPIEQDHFGSRKRKV